MATVRFSEDMRRRILKKAEAVFEDRVTNAEQNYPKKRWGKEVYDLMFKDTVGRMNALPDGYLPTTTTMGITGFSEAGWDHDQDKTIHLEFNPSKRIPSSLGVPGLGIVKGGGYGGNTLDASDPRWDTFKVEYREYTTALAKIKDERDTFVQGVGEVITAYATLAPALKSWPALWDLVPDTYKERHREIVERKKAALTIEADIDLKKMTAAVTLGKLTR